jgi:hypothetical protein
VAGIACVPGVLVHVLVHVPDRLGHRALAVADLPGAAEATRTIPGGGAAQERFAGRGDPAARDAAPPYRDAGVRGEPCDDVPG